LLVVLPGGGGNAQTLKDHDVHGAIQRAWPQIDVLLTGATLSYYARRVLVQHVEQDVLGPARRQGYTEIWLAGASIGGMGAIMYERQHPNQVTGLLLFAPWLGPDELLKEIHDAGGVRRWEPGPIPAEINGDNAVREMWRVIKGWSTDPAEARRIWLVCGIDDRHLKANRMAAEALPESQYLEVAGGHTMETWLNSAELVVAKLQAQRGD
jgi:pimeloyl-ACP methyl ester carboxylesterase